MISSAFYVKDRGKTDIFSCRQFLSDVAIVVMGSHPDRTDVILDLLGKEKGLPHQLASDY
jgi:hypothetical protein